MSDDGHPQDEYLWLEEVEGADALDWVRARNAESEAAVFTRPEFEGIRSDTLEILEADDRIAYPTRHGDRVHNFWTDAAHRRGILRRTDWESYAAGVEEWETILDVDALGAEEGESWVFHGAAVRRPDRRRALIALSPGGSDATVTREFDLVDRRFVPPDEGGFVRPLAKGGLTWIDDDTVYVTTDFGPGTLTTSGYPRTVRRWSRGKPMESAEIVFEGHETDVAARVAVSTLPGYRHHVFERAPDFFTTRTWVRRDGTDELVEIEVPDDAEVWVRGPWIFVAPRSDLDHGGQSYPSGSFLVGDLDAFLAGTTVLVPLFTPSPTTALADFAFTRHHVVINVIDDVRNRLRIARFPAPTDDGWNVAPLDEVPDTWTSSATAVDPDDSDDLWLVGTDFVTPETLHVLPSAGGEGPRPLRQAPHRFVSDDVAIEQRFTSSADGTRVPYFVVGHRDAVSATDGDRPTLLTGYGGFEVPRQAAYSAVIGRSWLTDGGVYVLANIRGGGEFGPAWHRAGLREKRPRVYEDFEAVARAVIDDGITSPRCLGISGGSNGGLLVGNMYVRTPELFGAVVCQVPLLDMRRYHLLLAGASWMAEYGDPDDPADWEYLRGYSPYHLVDPDDDHPPILLTTSTRDDRVHPGHARKMAARLTAMGKDVTYWENIEGGHGGAADATQQATMQALIFTFLRDRLLGG